MPDAERKAYPLRVDPALWAAVERCAAAELRSVNAQVECLLREALARARGQAEGAVVAQARTAAEGEEEHERRSRMVRAQALRLWRRPADQLAGLGADARLRRDRDRAQPVRFAQRPLQLFAILAPLIIAFMVICARTTSGGWRWRWGDDD